MKKILLTLLAIKKMLLKSPWDTISLPLGGLIGEGNGTPLQYSCLENPMGGGASWAAVHRVAKTRTWRATWLSIVPFMHWRRKWQPTPVFLPGESQDGGAWWAAVYGVSQSRARLGRLSSSSSRRRRTYENNNNSNSVGKDVEKSAPLYSTGRYVKWCSQKENLEVSQKVKHRVTMRVCVPSRFNHIQFFASLQGVACQAPLSMGFSRQKNWSRLPCPPPGESSPPRDRISCVSCISRPVIYHQFYLGSS